MKDFRIHGLLVQVEISPTFVKAWDTTNDSFSCVLKANTRAEPYNPMTPFQFTNDDNEIERMWIISDSVTIFSLNPTTYKHSLTLIQKRYKLNKHLLRNTVFNQPKKKKQKLFLSTSVKYSKVRDNEWNYKAYQTTDALINCWNDRVSINRHTKIKNASVCAKLYGHYLINSSNDGPIWSLQEIKSDSFLQEGNAQLKNNVIVEIYDANNNNVVIYSFNPFLYLNSPHPDQSFVENINNYIDLHNNTLLCMRLSVNGLISGGDGFYLSFAEATNTSIDPQGQDIKLHNVLCLQFEIETELFNYTMYDVINDLREQYRLSSGNFPAKKDYLFSMPAENSKLYNLLKTTYPPDTLAFTQATWYDALTEIFRFYDAGFKFKGYNDELEIEYYNDPLDERTDLEYSGKSMSLSDKDYNNGKIIYYQNAVQELHLYNLTTRCAEIGVPGSSDFAIVLPKPIYDINKITFNYSSYNTGEAFEIFGSDSFIDLHLDLTPFVVNKEIWSTLNKAQTIIIPYGGTELVQNGTIPFERGEKTISVSTFQQSWSGQSRKILEQVVYLAWMRFFGIPNSGENFDTYIDDWMTQRYDVEYLTSVEGRAEIQTPTSKYLGEELVNQSDGLIDLNKVGLNILGESLKNGEPTLTATCKFTNWEDRPQEGQYIIYNGSRWLINVVNISDIGNGNYTCTVEFSKNFNALSLRVKSDKEKRLTNISEESAAKSEDNYIDFIYAEDRSSGFVTGQSIPLGIENIKNLLIGTFKISSTARTVFGPYEYDRIEQDPYSQDYTGIAEIILDIPFADLISYDMQFDAPTGNYTIQVFSYDNGRKTRFNILCGWEHEWEQSYFEPFELICTYKTHAKNIDVATISPENVVDYDDIYIPMIKYGFGNSICFELEMDHPISAGNMLTKTPNGSWMGADKYFSEAIPYTDMDGWVDEITIDFYHITDYGRNTEIGLYPILQHETVVDSQIIKLMELMGGIWKLNYYKKPNEIFALNYQWCFLSRDVNGFFIGSKFINDNFITNPDRMAAKKFYLRYNATEKYAIMDIKGEGEQTDEVYFEVGGTADNQVRLYILKSDGVETSVKNWAIVDENNDIYFASNNPATFTDDASTTKFLTFTTRRNRI